MEVDPEQLARALGHEAASFTVHPIEPDLRLHSVTGGVYRVKGDDFSLIIKVLQHRPDDDPAGLWISATEPTHRNYWKREWLAYGTGLLDALPGELRAPRTMQTTEVSDDECWIWMEDVEGHPGAQWDLDDYDSVAFDLATTQAAYAGGRSVLPTEPWLARQWLRGWLESVAHQYDQLADDAVWQEPALAPLATLRPRLQALWEAQGVLLSIVEQAPQTVVHGDFWPTNLIAADDGTTVALDWSQVGIGALAQDLDQLTLDPVWMLVRPDASLEDLERHVLPGYLSGLRSSGIDIDDVSCHRWYAAAAALRYAPMTALPVLMASDEVAVKRSEARHGLPYDVIVAHKARVVARALTLGESVLDGR